VTLGKKAIDRLRPWLEGSGPSDNGEWGMHCPYHDDTNRSASINIETELWYCQVCDEGKEARDLIRDYKNWNDPPANGSRYSVGKSSDKPAPEIEEATIDGWASALKHNKAALKALRDKRGLTNATIENYEIGWDGKYYTIPIRNFAGEICNVRYYDINASASDRRKIWSVEGMGTPTLYPMDQLDRDSIWICEGEFDALLAIQQGIPAITRTGAADHWRPEWAQFFRGKRVFICHDMDTKGQHANDRVVASLRGKTLATTVVHLPYDVTEKHGKDITDYFHVDGHSREDFITLVRQGKTFESVGEAAKPDAPTLVSVNVMDSFNGKLVEKPLAMQVTVTGKRIPSYLVPTEVQFNCDLGAGKKCDYCTNREAAGEMTQHIGPDSPLILGMVESTQFQLQNMLMGNFGVIDCGRVDMNVKGHRTVEEIYVRPSIEVQAEGLYQDFTHRKVISSVTFDLSSNQTVDIFGTIRPDPRKQTNQFQAWRVEKPKNTLDSFELTPEIREQLNIFQDTSDPLGTVYSVAEDLAQHVTKIYHRADLHVFMDLVFHSCLRFKMGNEEEQKGWLDAIVLGDTRTGKSEVAAKLIHEYAMGEMVSCESATYAGVVGGLDRPGEGQWVVKWGAIPVNDRRIVVLDEVSGLLPEQIAQMSNIRSSGIAEMTKIQNERAMARTRLLWLANPRESRMDDFTFGVMALQPLIGNNEDIARFDMAMGVFSTDVSSDQINTVHVEEGERWYPREAMRNLLRWAWTRNCDDVVIGKATVNHALKVAQLLGDDFVDTPPLIQAANVRQKLMRVAIAIAIRTFNADARGRVVVLPIHVDAADMFLRTIYDNSDFGYSSISRGSLRDRDEVSAKMEQVLQFIAATPGLLRFLKHTPVFERNALETLLNMPKESANGLINELWDFKAVRYDEGKVKLSSQVLARIREL
jgi:hypothetical protein